MKTPVISVPSQLDSIEVVSSSSKAATRKEMEATPIIQDSLISIMSRFSDGGAAAATPPWSNTKVVHHRKKNVRFEQDDETGNIRMQTFLVEPYKELGADAQDLWYTTEEMRAIEWECLNIIRFFQRNKTYQQILMACLYPQQQTKTKHHHHHQQQQQQ
mmetsp:Transcript_957/g.1965  ORF Transcript_957/g.1965 Transcript_957/m.1965 type:complete len:159 (-) Transcript_957:787-1263(-)